MSSPSHRVLLRPEDFEAPPPPFRTGSAGLVRLDEGGGLALEERVLISANSLHAMEGHGVVDQLDALGLEGRLGDGVAVLIRPAMVDSVRAILYEADRRTYAGEWEFLVHREEGDPPTEFRVAVANREYQVTLVRLVDVLNRASRFGEGVYLSL